VRFIRFVGLKCGYSGNESFIQTLKDASDEMTSRTRFRRFFASLIVNLPPPIPEKVGPHSNMQSFCEVYSLRCSTN
jgi:hypothetical protein